jgi:hypothetical protein
MDDCCKNANDDKRTFEHKDWPLKSLGKLVSYDYGAKNNQFDDDQNSNQPTSII